MTAHPESRRQSPRSYARVALAALAFVALAACEPSTDEAAAAGTPPAAGGTARAAAPGGEQQRISMAECSTPSEGRVHFRVGEAVLAVPAGEVREVYPTGLQAPVTEEKVTTELRARAAEGYGCPEKPLESVLVLVGGDAGNPLLEGTIGILRSPPGTITDQFAKLTRDLQRNPTQNCRKLNGELLACVGTETVGQRQTPVMYVITTNTRQNLNTGGPLAARCVLQSDAAGTGAGAGQPQETGPRIRTCNIVDEAPGNLTIDATLNAGTFSTDNLAQAHRAALARVDSLRL
jgi:hypothetical protein